MMIAIEKNTGRPTSLVDSRTRPSDCGAVVDVDIVAAR